MPVENSKVIFGQDLDPKRGWFNHNFDRQVQCFFFLSGCPYIIYIYIYDCWSISSSCFSWLPSGYLTVMETMVHGKPKTWFLYDFDDFTWFSIVGISVNWLLQRINIRVNQPMKGRLCRYARCLVMQILVREYMNCMELSWNGGTPLKLDGLFMFIYVYFMDNPNLKFSGW